MHTIRRLLPADSQAEALAASNTHDSIPDSENEEDEEFLRPPEKRAVQAVKAAAASPAPKQAPTPKKATPLKKAPRSQEKSSPADKAAREGPDATAE